LREYSPHQEVIKTFVVTLAQDSLYYQNVKGQHHIKIIFFFFYADFLLPKLILSNRVQ